jgi:two-component system cell cycle response regulator
VVAAGDRLRHAVAGHPIQVTENALIAITVSVGVALVPDHAATADRALLVADRALYAAKHDGRNRTVVGDPHTQDKASVWSDDPTLTFLNRLAVQLDEQQSTAEHSAAIGRWAALVATEYGMSAKEAQLCELAGNLHDVGKVTVPSEILLKPVALSHAEWQVMRRHAERGARLVGLVPELTGVAEIVRQHHERFDGAGYPDRLAGSRISPPARIIALCDSYAAMRADRVYRPALTPEQAYDEILDGRGTQFDPDLTDLFLLLLTAGVIGQLRTAQTAP